jgi:hypothetical protein
MKNVYQSVLLALFTLYGYVSLAQLPVYNSYPAAQAVIFLDFDGQTINGITWMSIRYLKYLIGWLKIFGPLI